MRWTGTQDDPRVTQADTPDSWRRALTSVLPDLAPPALALLGEYRSLIDHPDPTSRQLLDRLRLQLETEFAKQVSASETAANRALSQLSPEVAFNGNYARRAASRPRADLLREAGLNRFLWSAGAGATGSDKSYSKYCDYLDAAAEWVAARYLLHSMRNPSLDLPHGLATNPRLEETRRMMSTEIRFAWVSELIFRSAAEAIAANPQKYGALSWMDAPLVEDYFATMRSGIDDLSSALEDASDRVRRLAQGFSVKSGSLGTSDLKARTSRSGMERSPFIQHGDRIAPVAARESIFCPEMALFELVRRSVPNEKDRGDLFEEVISRCLQGVSPEDLEVLVPPQSIRKAGSSDPLEVDFSLRNTDMMIIGEAKAYFLTRSTSGVINAFGDQIGKATAQLNRRLDAFRGGAPFTSGSAVCTIAEVHKTFGIATPLHSYAGAAWNSNALSEIGAARPDLAVIPIHQMILVFQSMMNRRDLSRYLDYRAHLLTERVDVLDQADILINYLDGNPFEHEALVTSTAARLNTKVILQPRAISAEVGLKTLQPHKTERREWRRTLVDSAFRI